MKNLLPLFVIILTGLVSRAQTDSITISGTLKGLNYNKVSISWAGNDAKNGYLSVQSKGDHFSARLPLQHTPVAARLSISWPREEEKFPAMVPPFNFFLFDKDITLEGDAKALYTSTLKGDRQNELYNNLLQQMAGTENIYRHLMEKLYNQTEKLSAVDSAKIAHGITAAYRENAAREKAFVKVHPDAFASVFILSRTTNAYGADEYIAAWNALAPDYKNTAQGKDIEKTVQRLLFTKAGTPVFDFERIDKNGNKVSAAALKGQAYILDFWGSWCGPCRASHPHLKELYRKYKSKGFEIVAIAHERGKTLDESKTKWLKAIEEDEINWVHILNQDGIEKQDIVKTFNVNAFPTKILVGADGKIITRTTSGASDAIDKALEKIYGF